jgi:hypothetical protein
MSPFFHIAPALGLALAASIRTLAPVCLVSAWPFATLAILIRRDLGARAATGADVLGGQQVSR